MLEEVPDFPDDMTTGDALAFVGPQMTELCSRIQEDTPIQELLHILEGMQLGMTAFESIVKQIQAEQAGLN